MGPLQRYIGMEQNMKTTIWGSGILGYQPNNRESNGEEHGT